MACLVLSSGEALKRQMLHKASALGHAGAMRVLLSLLLLTACTADGAEPQSVFPADAPEADVARLSASLLPLLPESGSLLSRDALAVEEADALVMAQFARIGALPPFADGGTKVRIADEDGMPENGVLAFSRFHPETGAEVLVVANFRAEARAVEVAVDEESVKWAALAGFCATEPLSPGRYRAVVAGFDVAVCAAVG